MMIFPGNTKIQKIFQLIILEKAELGAIQTDPALIYHTALSNIVSVAKKFGTCYLGSIENNERLAEWKKGSEVGGKVVVYKERWIAYTNESGPASGRLLDETHLVKVL
jgi:hypothetical protein